MPAFLLGAKKPPRQLPAYYGFGDESEALRYVAQTAQAWYDTPGPMDWLIQSLALAFAREFGL